MRHAHVPWGNETGLVDYQIDRLPENVLEPKIGTDFNNSRLEMFLRQMPTGIFYVVDKEFGDVDTEDISLTANGYIIPEFAQGRQESKWAVQFGQLALHSKSQGERTELVAMKSMPAVRAAHEYHANEHVDECLHGVHDYRTTFTTLGFYKDRSSKQTNLVTRYEHAVQSADGVMWDRSDMPSSDQVGDNLRKAAQSLADLHGAALIGHGDAQPKNIASDLRGVRIIDLEDAIDFRSPNGDLNTLRMPKVIEDDIKTFLTKLNGDYTDLVEERFAVPYLERLEIHEDFPRFIRPALKKIIEIAHEPQEPIPYLT